MKKRIVVCADGTWNRPEEDVQTDVPSNVLRVARAIKSFAGDGTPQHVFYDWGLGSYHSGIVAGATGRGIHKNIMDGYRYIVQNYEPGAEIHLFGFSRGAYTVRCLSGLINNCGILRKSEEHRIQQAFDLYKMTSARFAPRGEAAVAFRAAHSHADRTVHFVGVWDTVGALGVPVSLLGLFDRTDEFYDREIGSNVRVARHALAIDEKRIDFEPTLWDEKPGLSLKQVWFSGAHSDIGGGYPRAPDGTLASDYPLGWMVREARAAGLEFEDYLAAGLKPSPQAPVHESRRHIYRIKRVLDRPLALTNTTIAIHRSVRERWEADAGYRPPMLQALVDEAGWPGLVD